MISAEEPRYLQLHVCSIHQAALPSRISAKFKQRPWKTCQKPHIIHTLWLFLRKKRRNQGLTVNETMIHGVWPKSYIAVCFFSKCWSECFNKAKTYWMGLWVSKKNQIHHRSSSPPRFLPKICLSASFSRGANLITHVVAFTAAQGNSLCWPSRLRGSNINQLSSQ